MQQLKECVRIFCESFPEIWASEDVIKRKLNGLDLNVRYIDSKPAGFYAAENNVLAVLCVLPGYRCRGLASEMLAEFEEDVRNRGYDRVILGRCSRDLFFGAVMETMSHRFFEKRGYRAFNGCLSMYLLCENFSYSDISGKYPKPDDVHFLVSKDSLPGDIADAVRSVEPKWVSHYENCSGKAVITASVSGKTAGFAIAGTDAETVITEEGCRTGLLEYVGVVPGERHRGIGRSMTAFASEYMKSEGCTEIFINYTSLDTWYSGIGFEEYLWYWMGEKIFEN